MRTAATFSDIFDRIIAAAVSRDLLAGDVPSIRSRLHAMAAGLDIDMAALDAAGGCVHGRQPAGAADDLRHIGAAFWRSRYAGDGDERRRLEGSVYTPPAIIDAIIDLVEERTPSPSGDSETGVSVCDPAMGCGFFLLRLVERRLATAGATPAGVRAWARRCLYGVDLDPAAVYMARVLFWLALSGSDAECIPDQTHFVCGDALLGQPFAVAETTAVSAGIDWPRAFPELPGGFDVVVGNPPYEVLTNFARRPERRRLADAIRRGGFYRHALSGQINLYKCFIERSLDLLKPRGVLAMIVPLAFARDASAAPLRRHVIETAAADAWLLYGERERVFPGVTQSACIFRAVKDGGAAERLSVTFAGETNSLSTERLRRRTGGGLAIPVLASEGLRLLDWFEDNCPGRLGDVADMRVGEVDQTVFRECMRDEDTGCLLARGAHVSPFRLDLRPEPGHERFLDLRRFLEMKGRSAAACRERASRWRVVQLGIRNMHTLPRLVAALAPPGVYLGNSLNVFLPRDGVPAEYIAGVLNAAIPDWLFRAGSGNNNINLHEMRRLPFPSAPGAESMQAVVAAYRACAAAAAGDGDPEAAQAVLDEAVRRCYGLPGELLSGMRSLS